MARSTVSPYAYAAPASLCILAAFFCERARLILISWSVKRVSELSARTVRTAFSDISSVESEVAKAIADQLRAKLTRQDRQLIAANPTDNVEGHPGRQNCRVDSGRTRRRCESREGRPVRS